MGAPPRVLGLAPLSQPPALPPRPAASQPNPDLKPLELITPGKPHYFIRTSSGPGPSGLVRRRGDPVYTQQPKKLESSTVGSTNPPPPFFLAASPSAERRAACTPAAPRRCALAQAGAAGVRRGRQRTRTQPTLTTHTQPQPAVRFPAPRPVSTIFWAPRALCSCPVAHPLRDAPFSPLLRPPLRFGRSVRKWCEKAMLLVAKHESGAPAAPALLCLRQRLLRARSSTPCRRAPSPVAERRRR